MSRKTSQKRLEANRRNAQKSTGPRTPEGKAASAANSAKHGLSNLHVNPLSPRTLLNMEDETQFRLLYGQYVDIYHLQHQDEYDLLTEAVYAKWRQRRLWIAESAHLEVTIAFHADDLRRQLPAADKPAHLANAVAKSEGMLKLYLRYDAQLRRHYRQCLNDLRDLQASRLPLDDSPNEPNAPTLPGGTPDETPDPAPSTPAQATPQPTPAPAPVPAPAPAEAKSLADRPEIRRLMELNLGRTFPK